ncbi:MAG: Homoserine dehydrogenase, partial [Alphaproteobacteria bacterium MarineAlpha10_Bin3]
MTAPLRVAVAGLGTVGAETVRLIAVQQDILALRCGRDITVTAISARDRARDRGIDLGSIAWFDDPAAMARDADADVVVELIGGCDGVALDICRAAIAARRHVVTANKALIALKGAELGEAAEAAGVALAYESAVAGGIPIIKALREGLAANRVSRVHGILNGTCNYILTTMRETGRDFDDVLRDAQELGYAEADPSFDVDGVDTAHKLAILTSVAFGCAIDFDAVQIEGIRHIAASDIAYATELGYRIKLLGIAEKTDAGIGQRVHPVMVPINAPIAAVEGVVNGVVVEGDFVDLRESAGVDFVHFSDSSPEKLLPEAMGGGLAVFDSDADGDLDLYFVNGRPLSPVSTATVPVNALFLNESRGDAWSFVEVPGARGADDDGYGMGSCVGDYDGDGLVDLYVTNVGPNRLYHATDSGYTDATSVADVG